MTRACWRSSESELGARIASRLGTALEMPVRVELVRSEELLKSGHKIPRVIKP